MSQLERVFAVSESTEDRPAGLPAGLVLGRSVREVGYWDGTRVIPREGPCPRCGGGTEEVHRHLTDDETGVIRRTISCAMCGQRALQP